MRQFIIILLASISLPAFAGKDIAITVDQLPTNAKKFIYRHFAKKNISLAKMEKETFSKSYEVIFTNGSKVEFDSNGQWTEIDCEFSKVPDSIIPEKIRKYITTNYGETKVIEIDRDRKKYEVRLSNGLELVFDLKFNLIGIDD